MKTQIQSIHFDADNKLLDLIQEKVNELFKVYDRIESCDVILKLDKNTENKDKVVEINMNIPGKRLFTKNQSNKFEVAADMAIDDIKKQLNLHKNKIADRNSLGIEILQ
jgi:putative sigma-54 modulation protein